MSNTESWPVQEDGRMKYYQNSPQIKKDERLESAVRRRSSSVKKRE